VLAACGRNGVDGVSPAFRGTYDATLTYARQDVVALNGGSFVALQDVPGPCPGDGWRLVASAGKRGDKGAPGERGERGLEGKQGPPGASITDAAVDGYALTLSMSDGSMVVADLRPALHRYHNEARG
jgi:hypothetical protein